MYNATYRGKDAKAMRPLDFVPEDPRPGNRPDVRDQALGFIAAAAAIFGTNLKTEPN